MKKLFILFVLGLTVPAGAEIVSTVSYNPARMGKYDFLKVSKDAVFNGGLQVGNELNVSSNGTVSMEWDNNQRIYNVTNVTGGANTAVEMPQTTFRGGTELTSLAPSYNALNGAPANATVNVLINGGTLTATNNDSYVGTIQKNGGGMAAYQHFTTNLNAATLNIDGNEGNSVGLTTAGTSLGDAQTLGFHLAGVDIPHPTGHTVHKSGLTTKTGASLPLSSCTLAWVKRTAQEDTKTSSGTTQTVNKDVYVLAFTGCTADGGGTQAPTNECTSGEIKYNNKNPLCGGPKDVCVNKNGAWVWETQTGTFNGYPFHDAYCSKNDYQIYYCGACCQWSDAQNRCVAIGSNLTDLEPTNAKAKTDACAYFKSNYPQYSGRTDTGC